MQTNVEQMTTFDLINFITSIASIVLAIVAMLITYWHKREADTVNTETRNLLMDVKTDAKALAQVASNAMAELSEYGKTSREVTRQLVSSQMNRMQIDNLSTASPAEGQQTTQQIGQQPTNPPTSS